jgi:hypothetical protein
MSTTPNVSFPHARAFMVLEVRLARAWATASLV